jgi:starch synthase
VETESFTKPGVDSRKRLICVSPDLRPGVTAILKSLDDAAILEQFITQIAIPEDGKLNHYLTALPFARKAKDMLARRRISSHWQGRVSTYPVRELLRTGLSRCGMGDVFLDRAWWWAERGFDRAVARDWAGKCEFLYGFELSSAETFRAHKRRGGKTILNQLIAHYKTVQGLMLEEIERYPEAATNYDRHIIKSSGRVNELKDEQYALSDLILANSEFVRQSFIEAGIPSEKVVVVPGASPVIQTKGPASRVTKPLRFVSAGSQSIRKGTIYLLDAWRRLRSHNDAELWLVGKSTLPSQLYEGLPGKVVIKPAVSQAELFDIYSKSAVLVLPSLCEGFALVILEAMAHGLPVITTANSGSGDFVEDGVNGWVVPIRDPRELALRLEWCTENRDQLNEMGQLSRLKASKWTWEEYIETHGQTVSSFMGNPETKTRLKGES